ncbi:helix-turn-helix transcriptional regulator [Clostridium baratii]|uniref:helix-turn-helix domain-containing protein n=1 Tax=Clostridium baratii TaxID=1561 RepID=UPI0030CB9E7E
MNNKYVGKRIKSRRKDLNLTLKEVASLVGVASSTIQRYENGTISQLKLPVLEAIAKALNVNPAWFMREDANPDITIPQTSERILINAFNKLNALGKKEALKRVQELTEISLYSKK